MQTILKTIGQDLQFALRQLRRAPGFALTAILTLALGVGANTAIFSLLDQALLRALPVHDPASLVILEGTGKAWEGHSSSFGGDKEAYFSYPMFRDLQAQAAGHGLDGLLATSHAEFNIVFRNNAQIATGEIVSGNYFSLLGATPYEGRLLISSDDTAPGANPVAVLSYTFWQNQLAADPSLVGQTISLNGHPFQVVGIAAPGFHSAVWGERPALFVPMSMLDQVIPGKGGRLTNHKDRWMNILGRLAPGHGAPEVQASLAPLWHALRAEELKALGTQNQRFVSEFLNNSRLLVLPGAQGFSYQRGQLEKPLFVVMGMAVLVLLIASVNVGSLLIVRATSRMREFSLRSALGADRNRIFAQLITEGLVLGILGGTLGLSLAPITLRLLGHRLAESNGDAVFSTSLDPRILFFNFAVALGVSLLFSMAPAMQIRRSELTNALRGSNASTSGGLLGLRRTIVGLQVGLSVVLLIASGLFVRTMQKLRAVDLGFNPTHLVGFSIAPRLAGYAPDRIPDLAQRVSETLQALPGIQTVAVSDISELNGDSHGGNISIAGYTPQPDEDLDVEKTYLSPDFFTAMRIPLLSGRPFSTTDDATHPLVAVVNESLARRYFGSPQNALGKRIMDGASSKPVYDTEIVGIVPDFKQFSVRDAVEPSVFLPLRQAPAKRPPNLLFFYLRTVLTPADANNTLRNTMRQLDPSLALDNLRSMSDQIDENLANDRLIELLAISFGILATILAGVGLYGVLAYSTTQRTREIGIRMALGSSRLAVTSLILAEVFRLAALGVLCALPVAFVLTRFLRSQLFGVTATDPLVLACAVALIALCALAAGALPARRAASINPTEALRAE